MQVFILFIIFQASHCSPSPSVSVVMNPINSLEISLVTTRNQAYYLIAIPPRNTPNLLSFDWNVSIPSVSSGPGSIQFSNDNSTWSNLASFNLTGGEALGKQPIDSSWATPGPNYLRVSFWMLDNQYLSRVANLMIFVNYAETILLILTPFIVTGPLGGAVYILRKRNKRSTAITQ